MASPLLPYANSRLLVKVESEIDIVDGRIQVVSDVKKLVKCFLKRAQYSGVSSGSKKIPLESQLDGRMMPGASGDQFYYRGYALEYAEVDSNWVLGDDESEIEWQAVEAQYQWMLPGITAQLRFGDDPDMLYSTIERSSGIFGGQGIDEIIYNEIGGVQIQLTAGEVLN